jgi:hypothetical protein
VSARDELAAIVRQEPGYPASRLADTLLAAGYSKPRTITTVDELDALPVGTIILEVDGSASRAAKRHNGRNWWADGPDALSASALIPLPATVIYAPEES